MKFSFTPEEAQKTGLAVAKHFLKRNFKAKFEVAVSSDAPYRTTVLATKSELKILVEAQGVLNYESRIKEFASWLASRRFYAEFYLATMSDSVMQAGLLDEMR